MTSFQTKRPDPTDIHVGNQIRLARSLIGMSQERLGDACGVTFQQIQKYEKGSNRVGSSRLMQMAKALGQPVSYFYEGLDQAEDGTAIANPISGFYSTSEGIKLARAFTAIKSADVRTQMIRALEAVASHTAPESVAKIPTDPVSSKPHQLPVIGSTH